MNKLYLSLLMIVVCLFGCASGPAAVTPESTPSIAVATSNDYVLKKLWSTDVGVQGTKLSVSLSPAIDEDKFYLASEKGRVKALSSKGELLWDIGIEDGISAGLAVDIYRVYLVTADDELVALDKTNGKVLWKKTLTRQVFATPNSNNLILVLHDTDGGVSGYDPHSGRRLWVYQDKSKVLTRRGNSKPVFYKDQWVLQGLDNGKMIALRAQQGQLVWEIQVGEVRESTSHLSKIIDVDQDIQIIPNHFLAASHSGDVVVVQSETGKIPTRFVLNGGVKRLAVNADYLAFVDFSGGFEVYYINKKMQPWLQKPLSQDTVTQVYLQDNMLFLSTNAGKVLVADVLTQQFVDHRDLNAQIVYMNKNQWLGYTDSGRYELYQYMKNNSPSTVQTAPQKASQVDADNLADPFTDSEF